MKRPLLSVPMAAVLVWVLSVLVSPDCIAQVVPSEPSAAPALKDLPTPPSPAAEDDGGHTDEEPYFKDYDVYIRKHLIYPDKALKDGVSGRVIILCTVTKEGDLSDFKIEKSLSPECDQEAIRVLNDMPLWTPGKLDGRLPVDMKMLLYVKFILPSKNK